jgi:hypothetical protein
VLERLLQVNLNEGKEKDETIDVHIEPDWKRIKQSETQTTTRNIIKRREETRQAVCVLCNNEAHVRAFIVAEGKI